MASRLEGKTQGLVRVAETVIQKPNRTGGADYQHVFEVGGEKICDRLDSILPSAAKT